MQSDGKYPLCQLLRGHLAAGVASLSPDPNKHSDSGRPVGRCFWPPSNLAVPERIYRSETKPPTTYRPSQRKSPAEDATTAQAGRETQPARHDIFSCFVCVRHVCLHITARTQLSFTYLRIMQLGPLLVVVAHADT